MTLLDNSNISNRIFIRNLPRNERINKSIIIMDCKVFLINLGVIL